MSHSQVYYLVKFIAGTIRQMLRYQCQYSRHNKKITTCTVAEAFAEIKIIPTVPVCLLLLQENGTCTCV